jgi:hypothetical protein
LTDPSSPIQSRRIPSSAATRKMAKRTRSAQARLQDRDERGRSAQPPATPSVRPSPTPTPRRHGRPRPDPEHQPPGGAPARRRGSPASPAARCAATALAAGSLRPPSLVKCRTTEVASAYRLVPSLLHFSPSVDLEN